MLYGSTLRMSVLIALVSTAAMRASSCSTSEVTGSQIMDVVFEEPPVHTLVKALRAAAGRWARVVAGLDHAGAAASAAAMREAAEQGGWDELVVSLQPCPPAWGVWARWSGAQEPADQAPVATDAPPAGPSGRQGALLGERPLAMQPWRQSGPARTERDRALLGAYYVMAVAAWGDAALSGLHRWLQPAYGEQRLGASITELRKAGVLGPSPMARRPGGELSETAAALLDSGERELLEAAIASRPTSAPTRKSPVRAPPPAPDPVPASIEAVLRVPAPSPALFSGAGVDREGAAAPTAAQVEQIASMKAYNEDLMARTRKGRSDSGRCEVPLRTLPDYLRATARKAVGAGFDIEQAGSGHLRWRAPDGQITVTAATGRVRGASAQNTLAALRRIGVPVPDKHAAGA